MCGGFPGHCLLTPKRRSPSQQLIVDSKCAIIAWSIVALQVLLPQLEALNADITVLSADTDAERRKQGASSREVADLKDKLQQVACPLFVSLPVLLTCNAASCVPAQSPFADIYVCSSQDQLVCTKNLSHLLVTLHSKANCTHVPVQPVLQCLVSSH